jgi:hypothetical protein
MMAVANTTICVFNAGSIRLDDQIMGTITQYDILRCLPFPTNVTSARVNGLTLVRALNRGLMSIGTGMFISYAGLEYDAVLEKWFLQPDRQPLDDENLKLTITSIPYFIHNTELKHSSEILDTGTTITRAFISYLENVYTKATNHRLS